jgi:hypothetical protein
MKKNKNHSLLCLGIFFGISFMGRLGKRRRSLAQSPEG